MAKKKKGADGETTPEPESDKPEEKTKAGETKNDAEGKSKDKPIYGDKDMQTDYDELVADGKTDHQARQIVSLKHR